MITLQLTGPNSSASATASNTKGGAVIEAVLEEHGNDTASMSEQQKADAFVALVVQWALGEANRQDEKGAIVAARAAVVPHEWNEST